MAIPNFKDKIRQVHASGTFDLTTLEGCGAFTRACAVFVYASDPRIVMLKKPAGRTHVVDAQGRRHAADALLFLENGKGTSIDIISNSRTADAKPGWMPDTQVRYGLADAFVPDYRTPDPQEPPDVPTEPSDLLARVEKLEAWARGFR